MEQARWWTTRLPRSIPWFSRHYIPAYCRLGEFLYLRSGTRTNVQTIVQLLEAEDEQLANNIRSSQILMSAIKQLAADSPSAPPRRDADAGAQSDSDFEDDGMDNDGEGEISALARRILELSEGDKSQSGAGGDGPQFNPSVNGEPVLAAGGEHDDLRASVQRAFHDQK
jgi:vacuolar protein 8